MPRSTRQSTWSPSRRWPSRWCRPKSFARYPSFKNAQSTKSTFFRLSSHAPTSSNTSTCSKQLTTSTSFTNSATEALLTNCCKNKGLFLRKKRSCTSDRSSRPSRSYQGTTLCTGTSNQIISSSIKATSRLLTLDSASLSKTPTNWPKLCLDHPSTWLPK